MKLDISYNEFCTRYYSVAVEKANIILRKHFKKTGNPHKYMDLEYVKQICVSYALEKVYKNYDVDHEKGASVETYMSDILHNCLMTELGKEWTSVKRAHPKKVQLKRTKSKDTVDTNVSEGVPTCGTITSGPSGGSYIEATRVYERKEKVIERMMECIKKLQITDQIILDCWLNEKGSYVKKALERLGYEVEPRYDEPRNDIIQAVIMGSREGLCAFCRGIQAGSPVDAYVTPEPWAMPGYSDEVIMAAGAFTQGSSIELSADGPLRPPYTAFFQGGLTYESGKIGILSAAQSMTEK